MYLKRIIRYGNRIDFEKYHTARYGVKGEKRQKKKKPSREEVRLKNERNAIRKLYRTMVENFTDGDWHVVLTYAEEPEPELAEKNLRLFFDRMRRAYRAAGRELKWIKTTEWKGKRLHHHVVMNDCPGFSALLRKNWPHGGVHPEPLYADQNYEGLAKYLVKETKDTFREDGNPNRQRYSCSRNMKKPEEKVEVVPASDWRKTPSVTKSLEEAGYVLEEDSIEQGTDIFGYPFMRYTLKRIQNGRKRSAKQVHGRRDRGGKIPGPPERSVVENEIKKAETGRA